MTGTDFSDWYNQAEGTFVVGFIPNTPESNATSQALFDASNGTVNNRIRVFRSGLDGIAVLAVTSAGSTTVSRIGSGISQQNATSKSGMSYQVNDFAIANDGGSVTTDNSGALPVAVDRINIGSVYNNTLKLNGTIASIAYYPKQLSGATLQAITS